MPFIYRSGWGPRYYGGYGGYGAGLMGAALVGAAYASRPVIVQQPPVIIQQQAPAAVIQQQAPPRPGFQRVNITVPAGISPGMNFTVNYNGNSFSVACPAGGFPGKQILIDVPAVAPPAVPQAVSQAQYAPPPAPAPAPQYAQQVQYAAAPAPAVSAPRYPAAPAPAASYPAVRAQVQAKPASQVVVVKVPAGVKGGMEFDVTHNGQKYTIPCPQGVSPGQEIEVQL